MHQQSDHHTFLLHRLLRLQLLPNWFITYLLAILLTLMALRLYSKGKQTYAKETQLLLAAKAAAKERRKSLMRSDTSAVYARSATITSPEPGPADGPSSLSATSGGVAVPVGSRSMRRSGSYNNALSRSFSRLRGSLVVGFEPGTSLTSPPGVAPVTPSGRSLISPAGRYSLITRVEGEGEDVVGNSAGQDQQQLPGAAVEQYIASTLFQVRMGCEVQLARRHASISTRAAAASRMMTAKQTGNMCIVVRPSANLFSAFLVTTTALTQHCSCWCQSGRRGRWL